jgi:hypothetical protein
MLALCGSLIVYIVAISIGKHTRVSKYGAFGLLFFFALLQTGMYVIDMFNRNVPTP